MTLRNVVKKARKSGIRVTYKARKDGGIFIKSINGRKYQGVKGNKALRLITGNRLSTKSSIQRRFNARKFEKSFENFTTENLFKKAQREWRKANFTTPNKKISKLTKKGFEMNIKLYGEKKAKEILWNNIKYAKGLAYEDYVNHAKERIDTLSKGFFDSSLKNKADKISAYLEENKGNLKNDDLQDIHDIIYDYENDKIDEKTMIEAIEIILFGN